LKAFLFLIQVRIDFCIGLGFVFVKKQKDNGRVRIIPRHVLLAVRQDQELDELIGNRTIIPTSGVMPNIHAALLPQKKKNRAIQSNTFGGKGGKAPASSKGAGATGSGSSKHKTHASSSGKRKGKGTSSSSHKVVKHLATKSGAAPGQKKNQSSQQQDSREY
jgi:hypothetical protein